MKKEKVSFFSGPGLRIFGTLNMPDNDEAHERRGAIVFCPGAYGLSDMKPIPQLANRFADAGYISMQLDYRGFGKSEGQRWRINEWEQVEDVRSAITYLQARNEVLDHRIGLWGTSLGGSNVIYAGAFDARPTCIVAVVPSTGTRRMTPRITEVEQSHVKRLEDDRKRKVLTGKSEHVDPFKLMYPHPEPDAEKFWLETASEGSEREQMRAQGVTLENFWYVLDNSSIRPIDVVNKISPRPVLFILARRDKSLSAELELCEAAGEPKKIEFLEAGHHEVYSEPHMARMGETSLKWFLQHMPPNDRR